MSLQETHIRKKNVRLLENRKLGDVFCSSSGKKVRGVVCYINKHLNPIKVFLDDNGRFLAVKKKISSQRNSGSRDLCTKLH